MKIINWLISMLMIICVLYTYGCTTAGDDFVAEPDCGDIDGAYWWHGFESITGVTKYAVCFGMDHVDKDAYGGWDGTAPGCLVDVDVFSTLCREHGCETWIFTNEEATIDNFMRCWKGAQALKSNDLFVVYFSGHGGQLVDGDSEESDGLDESLCLYDGQLVDDCIYEWLKRLAPGVRVFMVTDCCNSGTNFRKIPFRLRRIISRNTSDVKCQVIHYGGCGDGQYSYGNESGGIFTTGLIDTYDTYNTYVSWWASTYVATTLSSGQEPTFEEFGPVDNSFRNAFIFE